MNYTIGLILRIVIAAVLAVILGNGSVVAFNHLPQKWFEDWVPDDSTDNGDSYRDGSVSDCGSGGRTRDSFTGSRTREAEPLMCRRLPDKLLTADNNGRQRLASTPWKYTFTALLGISGVYLAVTESMQFELCTVIVLAIVLEMAICDQMYRIVPDQLQFLLAASALGFITYGDEWWEPLAGAGLGLALGLSVLGLGRLIYHSSAIGGADIKFYLGMGLIAGRSGIIIIFVLTTLLFCIQGAILTISGRGSLKDSNAMLPAGFAAVLIYMLFLWNITGVIKL